MVARILDQRILGHGDRHWLRVGHSTKNRPWFWGEPGRDLGMYGLVMLQAGSGGYRDERPGSARAVLPGACLFLFPGLHHDFGGTDWVEAFIDMRLPLIPFLEEEGLLSREHPVVQASRSEQVRFQRLVQGMVSGRLVDPGQIQLQLHDLLLAMRGCRLRDPGDAALEQARLLLESAPGMRIRPEEAARAAGQSWETFRRRFSARYGLGPAQWRLRHRLHCGAELLLNSTLSQGEIAERCGFCDPFHFSRRFTAILGCPPSEFRRRHAGADGLGLEVQGGTVVSPVLPITNTT